VAERPAPGAAQPPPPLVTARELAATDQPVTLLDVRWSLTGPPGRQAYEAGHLPGAVFIDLDSELAASPGSAGRHPLPDPDALLAALRRAGVRRDRIVVCYDQRDATAAARAWWQLRDLGLDGARVLDGGYDGWVAAGGEVETGPGRRPEPGDVVGAPGHLPRLSADEAAALATAGVLLDARAGERFRGEVEPVDPVAGHVPGAVSAPAQDNVDAAGRFLPAHQLRRRFAALGVDGTRPVGVYCGSGVTAAHEILALQLAGVDAALWPGSWSEWTADTGRPVATGP
jgi:thiosulfate/3-mercaptopyruvate sulfurtransferase